MSGVGKVIDIAEELQNEGVSVDRLDYIYDLQKLLGVVLGLQALLQVVVLSGDDKARVSAAKELVRLDEDPDQIAERLRSAPFSDMSVDELEAIVKTGELDPEKAVRRLNG